MSSITIAHAADIHLGSLFRCESSEVSARRRREQMGTLENLMLYIAERHIPLVLLPGDIFDGTVSAEICREFFSKLRRYPEVRFVIAPGNHDYFTEGGIYDERNGLPENLFVFRSPEVEKIEFPELGVDVYGYAFVSPTMANSPLFSGIELNSDRTSLLCAHGALDDPLSPYCPLSSAELGKIGFDYVALGHIHGCSHKQVGNTSIAYCGCLEGRDFGETGPKGFFRVTIEKGRPAAVAFRKLCKRSYEIVSADISSSTDDGEACGFIADALSEFPSVRQETTFLRLVLTGSVSPEYTPDLKVIKARALKGFYYSEIRDETLPVFSSEKLENDLSIRGCFFRALKPMLLSDDPEERRKASEALRIGLRALDGRELC